MRTCAIAGWVALAWTGALSGALLLLGGCEAPQVTPPPPPEAGPDVDIPDFDRRRPTDAYRPPEGSPPEAALDAGVFLDGGDGSWVDGSTADAGPTAGPPVKGQVAVLPARTDAWVAWVQDGQVLARVVSRAGALGDVRVVTSAPGACGGCSALGCAAGGPGSSCPQAIEVAWRPSMSPARWSCGRQMASRMTASSRHQHRTRGQGLPPIQTRARPISTALRVATRALTPRALTPRSLMPRPPIRHARRCSSSRPI